MLEIYDIPEELVEKQLVGIQNCMHESEAGEDFIENEVEVEKLLRQGAAAPIASKETAHLSRTLPGDPIPARKEALEF